MKKRELNKLILSLTQDVVLAYEDDEIFINPWNEKKFEFGYKDINKTYGSIEELMGDPVINGKSLNEICQDVTLL